MLVLLTGSPRVIIIYIKCLEYSLDILSTVVLQIRCLIELELPRFNTLMHNYNVSFANRLSACDNVLVQCVLQFNL